MRVCLAFPGRFHTVQLARELHERSSLARVYTAYPKKMLVGTAIPHDRVSSYPWLHAPLMGLRRTVFGHAKVIRSLDYLDRMAFDRIVASQLVACDVFVGLSGCATLAARRARAIGAAHVCERSSCHIRVQDELLSEEARLWRMPYHGIDPRIIEREEAEYEESDAIVVPSEFARRSFERAGNKSSKVHVVPFGVDLRSFTAPDVPPPRDPLTVLFAGNMSLQKGLPYLLQAFKKLSTQRKRLLLAGSPSPVLESRLRSLGLWDSRITVLGPLGRSELARVMRNSHIFVLPSIQDGFGLVLLEAMASGAVVIGSSNTGLADVIEHGREGLIVPARDAAALADAMQMLIDDPDYANSIRASGVARVHELGGWRSYGNKVTSVYRALTEEGRRDK